MIDIKLIREQTLILDNSLKKRGLEPQSQQILAIDTQKRHLQQALDTLRAELKQNSGANLTDEQKEENKNLGQKIKQQEEEYNQISAKLQKLMECLPNLVSSETPEGLKEDDNIEIRRWEDGVKAPEKSKLHHELLPNLLDKATGATIAGSRFVVFRGQIAKLARVLNNWLLEQNIAAGYQEVSLPVIMNPEIAYSMGVLPKFEEDLFKTNSGQFLIPTGEGPLVGLVKGNKIDNLPILLTTSSPCFRSEAGAAGKDTAGIIRLHQFQKIEIFGVISAEQVEQEHQRLVSHVEGLLQTLGLNHRVLSMCAGDLGFHAYKKFDIEVWMPGMNRFVEISSCSQCHEFQSRRAGFKYSKEFSKRLETTNLPHTINGSSLPIERTLAAIIENYQTEEGIVVPEVLQEEFGGKMIKY